MTILLQAAAINLSVALICGAVIGSERQVRQRMAGLRTNALVALGAAAFVIFSQLVPNEVSPTRVAAQVVSGIGFLGAGIIFRDGFNVHGLNTAATLWCSAAVGLISGIGRWDFALLLTGFVVFINLGLRPVVRFLKKHTKAGVPLPRANRFVVTVPQQDEAQARILILGTLAVHGLHLSEIAVTALSEGSKIEIEVSVVGEAASDEAVSRVVQRLAGEPGIVAIRWQSFEDL
jgi:putative Mg2+ transporter-C (MgtC) family protein